MSIGRFLLLLVLAHPGVSSFAQEDEGGSCTVSLARGDRFEARWTALEAPHLFRFEAADGVRSVPGDQILEMVWPSAAPAAENDTPDLRLQFVNEDRLSGRFEEPGSAGFRLRSPCWGLLNVQLKHLRSVQWLDKTVGESTRQKLLAALAARDSREDRVILTHGDVLPGVVTACTATGLTVRSDLGDLEIGTDRLYGVVFTAAAAELAAPKDLIAVLESVGNDVLTAWLDSRTGNELTGRSVFGENIRLPLPSIRRLSFRNGAVVFLSDLEPESVTEVPFFEVVYPHRRDRSQGDQPLRLRGKTYPKGLGVHSRAILTYVLAGQFSRFQSDIGIDDEVENRGNAAFRVLADGKEIAHQPEVRGGQPPVSLDLDVQGVKKLTLVVDFGKDFHIADHADWAGARLLR
ncbi:MAG: NPCBM/NEW2 domain-containing protein [Planctomycetes bacterium]|nr:NPCBM/NEW2 domain-containing protein [Planctomycetota bacterium]